MEVPVADAEVDRVAMLDAVEEDVVKAVPADSVEDAEAVTDPDPLGAAENVASAVTLPVELPALGGPVGVVDKVAVAVGDAALVGDDEAVPATVGKALAVLLSVDTALGVAPPDAVAKAEPKPDGVAVPETVAPEEEVAVAVTVNAELADGAADSVEDAEAVTDPGPLGAEEDVAGAMTLPVELPVAEAPALALAPLDCVAVAEPPGGPVGVAVKVAMMEAEADSCSDFDALAVGVAEGVPVPVRLCAEAVAVADLVTQDVAEKVAELDSVGASAIDAEAVAEVEAEAISCSDFDALAVGVAEGVPVPVRLCAEAVAVADLVTRDVAEKVTELDSVGASAIDAEAVAEVEAEAISCSDFDTLAVGVAEGVPVPVRLCAEAVAVADLVTRDVAEKVAVEEHVSRFTEEPAGHSDGQPHGKQIAEVHAAEAAPYVPAEHGVGEVVL